MSKIVTIKKHQPERLMLSSEMVPVVGLEPTRYRYQRILSPSRLPIPSHRRVFNYVNIAHCAVSVKPSVCGKMINSGTKKGGKHREEVCRKGRCTFVLLFD